MTSPTSVDPFAGQPAPLPSKVFPTRTHNPTRAEPASTPALVKVIYDKTESMKDIDHEVIECAHSSVDECRANRIDLKIGLLFVRDIPENGWDVGLVDCGVVSIDEFKRLIAKVPLIGNKSNDESQLEGLLVAAASNWPGLKPGKVKHAIIITNSGTKNATNGVTPEEAAQQFRREGVRVHVIGPDIPEYKTLTQATGGFLFPIPPITKDYFTSIFQTIGKTVTQTVLGC